MQDTISQSEIQDSQLELKAIMDITPIPMGENNVMVSKVTWDNIGYYLLLLVTFMEKVKPIFKGGIKVWQVWKWGKLAIAVIKLIRSIKTKKDEG